MSRVRLGAGRMEVQQWQMDAGEEWKEVALFVQNSMLVVEAVHMKEVLRWMAPPTEHCVQMVLVEVV